MIETASNQIVALSAIATSAWTRVQSMRELSAASPYPPGKSTLSPASADWRTD